MSRGLAALGLSEGNRVDGGLMCREPVQRDREQPPSRRDRWMELAGVFVEYAGLFLVGLLALAGLCIRILSRGSSP